MCLTDQPSKGPHLSSQGQDGVSPVDHVQSGQRAKQRASSPLYDARPSYSGTKQRSSSPLCDTRSVHRGGKPCFTRPLHNVRLSFSGDRQRSYSPRRNTRSSVQTNSVLVLWSTLDHSTEWMTNVSAFHSMAQRSTGGMQNVTSPHPVLTDRHLNRTTDSNTAM